VRGEEGFILLNNGRASGEANKIYTGEDDDLRCKRCREGGLTGTRRTVEQDVDANLMPDKGSTQNGSGHFGLSAKMCKSIPGQRLGRHFSDQLIVRVGFR